MVRRLPVIQGPEDDPDAVHRPRSRWILIGALFTIVVWVPLVAVSMPLGAALAARASSTSRDALATGVGATRSALSALFLAGPPLVSFVLAGAASGAFITRFGSGTQRKDAMASGALGGLLAAVVAHVLGRGSAPTALVSALFLLALSGALGGTIGSAWGARKR